MRLLTKLAKNGNKDIEIYLNEKMYFEAYITSANECDVTYQEVLHDIEKEMELKNPKITEAEFCSIEYELMDLLRAGEIEEGEVIY